MAGFSLRTYEEILDDVLGARRWYESLGIATAGTRLEKIQETATGLIADLDQLPPEAVVDRWSHEDTYYALSDGISFGRIAREFTKIGPNLLPRRKLRTILEGPLSPTKENPGDESVNARNIFMEMDLAAILLENGLRPKGFDDLHFEFEGVDYFVQCKRLHSESRVEDNIRAAYDQLQKNNLANDHDRGLVALAIDKIVGPARRILRLEREADLTPTVKAVMGEFQSTYQRIWRSFVDTRVVGILIDFRFLCLNVIRNVVGFANYLALVSSASREPLQAAEVIRLRRLASCLGPGPERLRS